MSPSASTKQLTPIAIIGECDSCFKAGAMPYRRWGEAGEAQYLCANCAPYFVRVDAAKHHLHANLQPIIDTWQSHWQEQGLDGVETHDIIQAFGQYLTSRPYDTE